MIHSWTFPPLDIPQIDVQHILFLSLAGLACLLLVVIILHALAVAFCLREQQSQLYQTDQQQRQAGDTEDQLKIFNPRICRIVWNKNLYIFCFLIVIVIDIIIRLLHSLLTDTDIDIIVTQTKLGLQALIITLP